MSTKKLIGIVLLILGVVLLVYGYQAYESFGSQLSEAFSGTPSDQALWFLIVGGICSLAGLVLLITKS